MGRGLTNVVGFLTEQRLCQRKIPLSLQTTAVCLSESVGDFLGGRFHGGFISGQTENRNPWGVAEKRK